MSRARLVRTTELAPPELAVLRELLDTAFAGDFGDDDWEHALGGWHALVTVEGVLVAHAAVVERAIELAGRWFRSGYVEAVATVPDRQGEGFGTVAVRAVSEVVRERFELGVLSTGAHGFYERLGWERWMGPSWVVDGDGRRRTPEDDDGLMVLRSGPSAAPPPDAPIACRARRGDDW